MSKSNKLQKSTRNHIAKNMIVAKLSAGEMKDKRKHRLNNDKNSWETEALEEIDQTKNLEQAEMMDELYSDMENWDRFHHNEMIKEGDKIYTVKCYKLYNKEVDYREWYYKEKLHRELGPAMEYLTLNLADENNAWYIDGEELGCKSQKEFERLMKIKCFW